MSQPDTTERRGTYLSLITLFLGLFGLVSALPARNQHLSRAGIRPWDLLLLALSTFRMGRLAAYDKVTSPLRAPFTETKPDPAGGDTTVAAGSGARRAIGELFACPTCSGTWIAAFLVYGLRLAPARTRLFLAIMATTGLAELLDAAVEFLKWGGRAARDESSS